MIDLHTHVLPGLDDGARTLEDSLAMVRMAAAAGTTDIVATPHADETFDFHPDAAAQAIEQVQQACGASPRLHYGCELNLTVDLIEDVLRAPERYTIGHGPYLLVEFSNFLVPKGIGGVFARMIAAGIRPLIAHPERNPILRKRVELLQEWVAQGCAMQVTAQSLTGRFGKSAKSAGDRLLAKGLVHVIASDAHDTLHRPPLLDEAWKYLEITFDSEAAHRLLVRNPQAVLEGRAVETVALSPRRRPWYAFWNTRASR